MGAASLSWSEIESWLRVTHLSLTVWEKLTIKKMSEVYAGELGVATKRDAQAPYTHVDEALIEDRTVIAIKLKSVFANFKKNRTEIE
jgi:hypothetical protein